MIAFVYLISCEKFHCEHGQKLLFKEKCNLIVERNYNTEKSSFALGTLKIRGTDAETGKEELFGGDRGWEPFAKHIFIGDTVVKKEGEAIMRIYKKDSIITLSYQNVCDENFDWDNILTFVLRDSISKYVRLQTKLDSFS